MNFTDTHVHLHFPDYHGDQTAVVDRARKEGVNRFITVGTTLEDSRQALETASRYDGGYAAVGIHPHEVERAKAEDFHGIEMLFQNPRVVGLGEVGLDFFRQLASFEKQKESFRTFMGLYRRVQKPIIIHCRDAYQELAALVAEEGGIPYGGVIHCYSSDQATVRILLDAGFYISFSGMVTYKKSDALREACQFCPLDRMLLETDGPYLAPQAVRGRRNEPAFLVETAKIVASIHGVNPEDLAEKTTANAESLFGLC